MINKLKIMSRQHIHLSKKSAQRKKTHLVPEQKRGQEPRPQVASALVTPPKHRHKHFLETEGQAGISRKL